MSVFNFQTVKNLVNITLSIALVASLTPSLFANAAVTAGTTQLNQINFEPSVSLQEVRDYLKNNKFKNLKNASIVADLETNDFVLPINLDLELNDDKDNSKTVSAFQNTKKQIVDGIRQAKRDINKPKQKFDSKKLLESFQVSSSSVLPEGVKLADNLPKLPAPTLPTEEELKYYEDNGVLPPIKVDPIEIKKLIKDSGLPENYPIPHLDPIQKGKFSNARVEDRLNSMTPAEKVENQKRVDEAKLQEELVAKTTEEELVNIEKDSTANKFSELKISQLNYYTEVGDSNAKETSSKARKNHAKEAKEENKAKLQKNDQKRKDKQNSQELKNKRESKKIEDKVKDTVAQDITSLFKVSDEETAKTKAETEKQKQSWIENAKTNKQQLNEYEAEGYAKEGLDVSSMNIDVIDSKTNKVKDKTPKKKASLDDLLKFGSVTAEAKGLNNAKYSLLIYNNQDNGQSFNAPSNTNWTQLKLYYTNGYTGQQRWCFDNDSNQIYLSNTSECQGKWGQKCIHALDGAGYGSRVGLYDCSWNNYNDAWQKWVFDEQGRLSLLYRQDMCIEKAWGLSYTQLDKGLVMWGCNSGAGKENQEYRAGYNDFAASRGMSIWSTNQGGIQSLPATNGHTFIEMWNFYGANYGTYGTHNSFSKFGNSAVDGFTSANCGNSWNSLNNICDYDNLFVNNSDEQNALALNNGGSSNMTGWRRSFAFMNKKDWDYLVFGSGYRSNKDNYGRNINLGGDGTYYSNGTSASRANGYASVYSSTGTNFCTGYSLTLWKNFRSGGGTSALDNLNWWDTNPTGVYNNL